MIHKRSIEKEESVTQGDTTGKASQIDRDQVRSGIVQLSTILSETVGSQESKDSSPHLAASKHHPVGGRHLAKLLKKGNPCWGE